MLQSITVVAGPCRSFAEMLHWIEQFPMRHYTTSWIMTCEWTAACRTGSWHFRLIGGHPISCMVSHGVNQIDWYCMMLWYDMNDMIDWFYSGHFWPCDVMETFRLTRLFIQHLSCETPIQRVWCPIHCSSRWQFLVICFDITVSNSIKVWKNQESHIFLHEEPWTDVCACACVVLYLQLSSKFIGYA